jgi:hypothetical protein
MFETEALKTLGAFPLVQAGLVVLMFLSGIWLMFRGERDKKSQAPDTIPQWTMMGPMHDAIGAIHDMAEQGRKQTDVLERIEQHAGRAAEDARQAVGILEAIRNESRLR